MALLPNAQELAAVEAVMNTTTTYYMSLHTATPGTTGANEWTGGSYARQSITWSAGANSLTSATGQNFTNSPNLAATYVGFWTAATGGTFIAGGTATVNAGAAVPAGSTVAFAAGQVTAAVS